MLEAMSIIKLAQDEYHLEHTRYAGKDKLQPVTELEGLGLSENDFPKMNYVDIENLLISVNYPEADEYLLLWLTPDLDFPGAEVNSMGMDHNGKIYRQEDDKDFNWKPDYPHLQETITDHFPDKSPLQ